MLVAMLTQSRNGPRDHTSWQDDAYVEDLHLHLNKEVPLSESIRSSAFNQANYVLANRDESETLDSFPGSYPTQHHALHKNMKSGGWDRVGPIICHLASICICCQVICEDEEGQDALVLREISLPNTPNTEEYCGGPSLVVLACS